MQATIKAVSPNPRVWDGPKGTLHFINVVFENGSAGDYGAKPETSQQHVEALQALVGTPGDYELEPKGAYQGTPQFKIKSYPGQTVGKGFGGGGKTYTPAWGHTEEGERYTQERMDRRTALMQAVQYVEKTALDVDVLAVADNLYTWLRQNDTPRQNTQKPAQEPMRETAQVQAGKWAGPGKCPSCECVPNGPHRPGCQGASE